MTLFNIPVTYHGSIENLEVDCMMDFGATLRVAKAGSNLTGAFQAKPEYRNGCADINFNLHLNADISKEDSILHAIKVYKETNQVWRPTYEDTLVAVNIIPRKVENYVIDAEYKERENIVSKEITVTSDSLNVAIPQLRNTGIRLKMDVVLGPHPRHGGAVNSSRCTQTAFARGIRTH